MNNKDIIAHAVIQNELLFKVSKQLVQLKEGLKNILSLIQHFPSQFYTSNKAIDAEDLIKALKIDSNQKMVVHKYLLRYIHSYR